MVYFVGAGPGAPDLITVRGQELLKRADIIIYAGSLVNAQLLKAAPACCLIYNSAVMTLEEVVEVMVQGEREGKTIVRLHTGDPSLYGAIREQMDRLEEAGIAFEVCPGVSSFCGAAASLQAEYTLPGVSQTVIITRMEGRTPVPERERLRSLAAHGSTLVLFLSTGLLKQVREELLAGGLSPDTPCAVCYKVTWEDEKILRGTLKQLPELAEAAGVRKTALIVVGESWVLIMSFPACMPLIFPRNSGRRARERTGIHNESGDYFLYGKGSPEKQGTGCPAAQKTLLYRLFLL